MKAAVLYKPGDIKVVDIKDPKPGEGEVLIRIYACGVCGTDHSLFVGGFPATYPVIIGHEFSGVVAATGKGVKNFVLGDRVTVDPNRVCHRCEYCRMGSEHLCENLSSMGVHSHGADAEYCVMPETNVYKIPDNVTFEEAAFCEPLACAIHGLELAHVRQGDTVLILGAGGMGNLITQLASQAGAAQVIVSEPIKFRREKALENGATSVIDPLNQDVDSELRKIRRIGADVVLEVAGNLKLQSAAIYYARKGGQVVWFGCSPSDGKIEVNPYYVNDAELKISGSFNNPFATARAVRLLGSKKVRVDNLISHHIALKDYLDVFKIFGGPDTLKLMVHTD
jgi:2-desacetyl-2-hydroxyethyl bacteriochlorophyllide A dehydrogenase